jgi:hypothetical protein
VELVELGFPDDGYDYIPSENRCVRRCFWFFVLASFELYVIISLYRTALATTRTSSEIVESGFRGLHYVVG